jgi:hypothetical protein
MLYEPAKTDHGLAFNAFTSILIRGPIGWTTTGQSGDEGRGQARPAAESRLTP